jgi:hypothetical protein
MYKFAMIIITAIALPGCASIAGYYRVDPIITRNTSHSTSSYYSKDGKSVDVTSAQFETKINSITDKNGRNKFIRELMSVSNDVCELHKAEIISNSNTWNITTGTASNILSGLGTVLGGEVTKTALAAGAALTNSSRSLVNQEIYANSLATMIVRAIDLKRSEARTVIDQELSTKALADYTTWGAVYDVDEYHRRCSFITGLVEVTKALDTRKESRYQLVARIQLIKNQITDNKVINAGYDPTPLMTEIEKMQVQLATAPE